MYSRRARKSGVFLVLLVFLLGHFIYQCNIRYDDTEKLVKAKINNLTVDYQVQESKVNRHFKAKMLQLKKRIETLMDEQEYYLENLRSSYHWEKKYMNTTAFVLYSMYLPHDPSLKVLPLEYKKQVLSYIND